MLYLILYTNCDCNNNSISFKNIRIKNEIKTKYKQWAVLSNNAFIIESSDGVTEIRNRFLPFIGVNNKLFITKIMKPAAWAGYDKRFGEWIKKTYNEEKDSYNSASQQIMKNYSCRTFTNINDLLNWLNKEQEYINVVSIMYLDKSLQYEVIFYTEDNPSGDNK